MDYIKTIDDSFIKKSNIRWFIPFYSKELKDDCFAICTKSSGCLCNPMILFDKWLVCMKNSPESYKSLQEELKK